MHVAWALSSEYPPPPPPGGEDPGWNLSYSTRCHSHDHGGSVVEFLTQDRGVAGSSLNVGTVLCP